MNIVTPNQYYEDQANFRRAVLRRIPKIRHATVIELTRDGAPIIQFGEDALPAKKIYPRLKSYVPVIGERVMLINGVIQGGIMI